MRNMKSTTFCSVCTEGLWLRFLRKVDLIDNIAVEGNRITANIVPLAHLRPVEQRINGEEMNIEWLYKGTIVPHLNGKLLVEDASFGDWELRVEFKTPEIRKDPSGYTKSSRKFTI